MYRKRQRRQQAAVVVQSLMGNGANSSGSNSNVNGATFGNTKSGVTNSGRKSTAQPRPTLTIPPKGIGPIVEPNMNDVLCGRGGRINSHPGNIQFRDIVVSRKEEYLAESTKKLEKAHIAAKIISDIRSMDPPGRFLKEENDSGLWYDIGDAKAIKKAGQALREDAPEIRPNISDHSAATEKPKQPKKSSPPSQIEVKKAKSDRGDSAASTSPAANEKKGKSRKPINAVSVAGPASQGNAGEYNLGPQHFPGRAGPWEQNSVVVPSLTAQEQQAQIAMPPPLAQQKIPAPPHVEPVHRSTCFPNELDGPPTSFQPPQSYSNGFTSRSYPLGGGRSVGGSRKSRQVMEALGQSQQERVPPEDIAFGLPFHPPMGSALSGNTMSSISGHTMSEVSGLTDPVSGMGHDTGDAGMGHPPVRSYNYQMPNRIPGRPNQSDRYYRMQTPSRGGGSSLRSVGSLSRSSSFPDVASSVCDGASWDAIMEAEEEGMGPSVFRDGEASVNGLSLGSFTAGSRTSRSRDMHRHRVRHSGGMSIASGTGMSVGTMSIDSGIASQWFGNSAQASAMDDTRSAAMLSDMSSDLSALDLAG